MTDGDDGPKRDASGRWRKGVSGNNKGRPRRATSRLSEADPYLFGQELVPVTKNGKRVLRTRREVHMAKMWERAMAGNASALGQFTRMFAESDKRIAEARALLDELEETWILNGKASEMPFSVELQIVSLRSLLRPDGEFWRQLGRPNNRPAEL